MVVVHDFTGMIDDLRGKLARAVVDSIMHPQRASLPSNREGQPSVVVLSTRYPPGPAATATLTHVSSASAAR